MKDEVKFVVLYDTTFHNEMVAGFANDLEEAKQVLKERKEQVESNYSEEFAAYMNAHNYRIYKSTTTHERVL